MLSQNLSVAWHAFNQGRFVEAKRLANAVASSDRPTPVALLIIGVSEAKLGNFADSETALVRAQKLDPSLFDVTNWLSYATFHLGKFEEAEAFARRALMLQPGHADAFNNLGLSLLSQGRVDEAITAFRASVKAEPRPSAYANLGNALVSKGAFEEAEAPLKQAIALGGDGERVRVLLAEIAFSRNHVPRALVHAQKAVAFNPESARAQSRLGNALWLSGDGRAVLALETAVRLDPTDASAHANLGAVLMSLGRSEGASNHFRKSAALRPVQGVAYHYYLVAQNASDPGWETIVEGAKKAFADESLPPASRSMLCFGLAKVHERAGECKEAMDLCDQGRALDHSVFHGNRQFDSNAYRQNHTGLIERYTEKKLGALQFDLGAETQPIFVIGMMRSGTTLVDQILSSHSKVKPAGEVGFLLQDGELGSQLFGQEIDGPALRAEANRYLKNLMKVAGESPVITDKMPANYLVAGLLHAAFPKAKLVHVRRNPLDTCLSIWTTYNRTPPLFAGRKQDVVFAYKQYLRLMEHWREVIPGESMVEIDYEDLVTAHEGTVRKLIAFCGLDWEDACFFHERNRHSIATPSLWQARQPIYGSSIGRGEKFRPFLGALDELSDSIQRT